MTHVTRLFTSDEEVKSSRLSLRGLTPSQADSLAWAPAALAPEWSLTELLGHCASGEASLISDASGEPIGAAVALIDRPQTGDASVPFIAIDPSRRFRGLGGEAGLMLERHLRAHRGVRRLFACVPDGRGLAVYFWLRLGYRPLQTSESPGPLIGLAGTSPPGIWMLRERD